MLIFVYLSINFLKSNILDQCKFIDFVSFYLLIETKLLSRDLASQSKQNEFSNSMQNLNNRAMDAASINSRGMEAASSMSSLVSEPYDEVSYTNVSYI